MFIIDYYLDSEKYNRNISFGSNDICQDDIFGTKEETSG